VCTPQGGLGGVVQGAKASLIGYFKLVCTP
jgi:hypothetical protein